MFAAIAVGATLLVVVQSNPVYSVLLLIGSFVALAGLYVLLDAPFVAVIQIIVYAGAIMVLFLFVVMLLNAPREEIVQVGHARVRRHARDRRASGHRVRRRARLGAHAIAHAGHDGSRATGRRISVAEIGQRLFQEYAFAFEVTSILILVAMVGAVTLAGRHLAETEARIPSMNG